MAYNGWKNYQTWNVALWFGNDEGLYHAAKEHRAILSRGRFNAKTAEDFVRDLIPRGTPDLKTHESKDAFRGVQWSAIAECFNDL